MILIVDDDPLIAQSLKELLDMSDRPSIAASTREELEDAIQRYAAVIQVSVEDIPEHLPAVRSGGSALVLTPYDDIIRSSLPTVQRIFMSASPGRQLPHVTAAGFRGLAKPFHYDELETTLQAVDSEMTLLYTAPSLPLREKEIHAHIVEVNDAFLRYLADHPEELNKLPPRRFEELVAELLSRSGFVTQLQKRSRDGGIDVVATKHELYGEMLLLVQCKQTLGRSESRWFANYTASWHRRGPRWVWLRPRRSLRAMHAGFSNLFLRQCRFETGTTFWHGCGVEKAAR